MFKVIISYNHNYKLLKNCMIILTITDRQLYKYEFNTAEIYLPI